jgi:hypothetical protein
MDAQCDHQLPSRSAGLECSDRPVAAKPGRHRQCDQPYYGDAAGDELTALLREPILGAAKVLAELKADDQPALQAALDDWYANAHDIAVFLSSANPKNWPLAEMDRLMRDHLAATTTRRLRDIRATGRQMSPLTTRFTSRYLRWRTC